jgi:hypothetical protein
VIWNRRFRTWYAEAAVVALVLSTTVVASGGGWVEWVGAGAVQLSWHHAQISDRMAEREAMRVRPAIECHRWSLRYFVGKEMLWVAYFTLHRTWSALAGCAIFLAYPMWRAAWRRRHPLSRDMESLQ